MPTKFDSQESNPLVLVMIYKSKEKNNYFLYQLKPNSYEGL